MLDSRSLIFLSHDCLCAFLSDLRNFFRSVAYRLVPRACRILPRAVLQLLSHHGMTLRLIFDESTQVMKSSMLRVTWNAGSVTTSGPD